MHVHDDTAIGILRSIGGASAVTLEGGYAVGGIDPDGTGRTLFEPAAISDLKRNENDRCTHLTATYKDGSQLVFTWRPDRGPRYEHRPA